MKTPCKVCNYYKETSEGHRTFMGCKDKERQKGFIADNYWYDHKCTNCEPREECLDCEHYSKPYGNYCNSVMGFVNGKCIDKVVIIN